MAQERKDRAWLNARAIPGQAAHALSSETDKATMRSRRQASGFLTGITAVTEAETLPVWGCPVSHRISDHCRRHCAGTKSDRLRQQPTR